jgi:hypothetical protein
MSNIPPGKAKSHILEGDIGFFGNVAALVVSLLDLKRTGILSLKGYELHIDDNCFTFVDHPFLEGEAAIWDILERKSGGFYFLYLPVSHHFRLRADALLLRRAVLKDTQEQEMSTTIVYRQPLQAVVQLPSMRHALVYARQIAPLRFWRCCSEGLRLDQPNCLIKIQNPNQQNLIRALEVEFQELYGTTEPPEEPNFRENDWRLS